MRILARIRAVLTEVFGWVAGGIFSYLVMMAMVTAVMLVVYGYVGLMQGIGAIIGAIISAIVS